MHDGKYINLDYVQKAYVEKYFVNENEEYCIVCWIEEYDSIQVISKNYETEDEAQQKLDKLMGIDFDYNDRFKLDLIDQLHAIASNIPRV